MSTTIKKRRLELGLSKGELADRIGVTEDLVERWEEVGLGADPMGRIGGLLLTKIMEALEVEDGLLVDFVPDSPKVGDFVITPGPGVGIDELLERAEELNLRVVIPDEWGQTLKRPSDATDEDYAAIQEHFRKECDYALHVSGQMQNALDLLGANTGTWRNGQTMRERIEEIAQEAVEDLEAEGGSVT